MTPFGPRLDAALDARGPLCVGIDPHPGLLDAWRLPRTADGLARFAATCAEAFADVVAVVKPQSAFFEMYGSAGIAALEQAVAQCRAGGALVLLDVKRGDIGTTMAAYATAYLDPSAPLAADAMTANPFLGVGSLQPAFDAVEQFGAGVFVLAATSNPEGPQVQHARADDGRVLAQTVIDELAAHGADTAMSSYGVVVGATIDPGAVTLDEFPGPVLAPGVGAQGGTAESVRQLFGDALPHVLPSVSREVLRAGPDVTALRDAARRIADDFAFLRA